jgi:hypothetical protein
VRSGEDGQHRKTQSFAVTVPSEFHEGGGEEPAPNAWEMLGIPEPPFLADELAPQVDREFVRRFVQGKLPEQAAATASRLILLFGSWSLAHREILSEEADREQT